MPSVTSQHHDQVGNFADKLRSHRGKTAVLSMKHDYRPSQTESIAERYSAVAMFARYSQRKSIALPRTVERATCNVSIYVLQYVFCQLCSCLPSELTTVRLPWFQIWLASLVFAVQKMTKFHVHVKLGFSTLYSLLCRSMQSRLTMSAQLVRATNCAGSL